MDNKISALTDLLEEAVQDGEVSDKTASLLTDVDTLRQIKKGDGVDPDAYPHSEARIITILLDDSGSIEDCGNTQVMIDGHNTIIDALRGANKKQQQETIVSCRCLNGGVLYPYQYLADVPELDRARFSPGGGTPLYQQAVVVIGGVILKTKEFEDRGVSARSWTLVVTDGANYSNAKETASDVAAIVRDLNSEQNIILAMGVSDGHTDFTRVFKEMGIKDANILLADGKDKKAIRRKFNAASQSAVAMNTPNSSASSGSGLLD